MLCRQGFHSKTFVEVSLVARDFLKFRQPKFCRWSYKILIYRAVMFVISGLERTLLRVQSKFDYRSSDENLEIL